MFSKNVHVCVFCLSLIEIEMKKLKLLSWKNTCNTVIAIKLLCIKNKRQNHQRSNAKKKLAKSLERGRIHEDMSVGNNLNRAYIKISVSFVKTNGRVSYSISMTCVKTKLKFLEYWSYYWITTKISYSRKVLSLSIFL